MNVPKPEWAQQMTLELAHSPALWRELLRRHVADQHGRCCGCTRAGTGIPAAVWPCALHALADRARAHHDRTSAVPRPADR